MKSNEREVHEFTGRRIRYCSSLSFDEVLARLRARVGELAAAKLAEETETREDFEAKIREHVGDSGFILMAEVDHSRWIKKYGIERRVLRWIFGNPLIAITMIRHDYTAGLFAPVELLLAESDDGASCSVTYVVPSSLIVIEENPQLLAAAQALDAKVEALVAPAVASSL